MLNTISTTTWDITGFVELDVFPRNTSGETRRRVNRIATLDGGAVFNDFGHSEADRVIELTWRPTTRATEDAIDRMVQVYEQLQIATRAGVFLAAPEVYRPGADESTLRLLVVEKLSA